MTISLSNDSTSLCLPSASQGSKHIHQHCPQASPAIAGSPPHTHGGGPARTLQPQPARVLCLSQSLLHPDHPTGAKGWYSSLGPSQETKWLSFWSIPSSTELNTGALACHLPPIFLTAWPVLKERGLTFSRRYQGLCFCLFFSRQHKP